MLAIEQYIDGTRSDSLMRGAVLNKSRRDLQDIAAYYAGQKSSLNQGAPAAGDGAPPAPGPRRGGASFDHGARGAEFQALLARAVAEHDSSRRVDESACADIDSSVAPDSDRDGDGLADRFDAAPDDDAEFVADTNGDGRFRDLQRCAVAGNCHARRR